MPSIYDPNPLAEVIRETDPLRYDAVKAIKDPPRMFAGGTADFPAFTASGLDPEKLLLLPYGVRHAAAAEPDPRRVYALLEGYAQGAPVSTADPVINHPGLDDARDRLQSWLDQTDLDPRTAEQREADDAAEYAQFFPVDQDAVSYAAEQARRAKAGETPLEDFGVLRERRRVAEQWAKNRQS